MTFDPVILDRWHVSVSFPVTTKQTSVQTKSSNGLNPVTAAAACHSVEEDANVYLPDDRRPRRDDSQALTPRQVWKQPSGEKFNPKLFSSPPPTHQDLSTLGH